jgi:hypothetical protein
MLLVVRRPLERDSIQWNADVESIQVLHPYREFESSGYFFLFCRPAPNKVCACSTACASCYKNSLIYRPELPGFSFSTKKIHLSINSKLLLKSAMIVMVPPGLWPTGNLELSRTSVLLFSQVKEILAAWKLNSLILIGNYCIISR